jgi:hypothetical protein
MKSFKEWRENREINEISSDLLNRAANTAARRPDARGERLTDKFNAAIPTRIRQEFDSNQNKIRVMEVGSNDVYDVAIQSFGRPTDEGIEYELKCNAVNPDHETAQIFNVTLRISYLPSNGVRNVGMRTQLADAKIMLDRMNAVKLTKYINSNGGNIKPTEFPLS